MAHPLELEHEMQVWGRPRAGVGGADEPPRARLVPGQEVHALTVPAAADPAVETDASGGTSGGGGSEP